MRVDWQINKHWLLLIIAISLNSIPRQQIFALWLKKFFFQRCENFNPNIFFRSLFKHRRTSSAPSVPQKSQWKSERKRIKLQRKLLQFLLYLFLFCSHSFDLSFLLYKKTFFFLTFCSSLSPSLLFHALYPKNETEYSFWLTVS